MLQAPALMSTFDSTINAGASYVVNDIWHPLRKRASERELVRVGYAASVVIVALGLMLSLQIESIVEVWKTIVIGLFPAFLVPFALRWYWERLNGIGFTLGVATGFMAAFATLTLGANTGMGEVALLATITACSLVGSILGSLLSQPTAESVRKTFYKRVRPFGLWYPAWKAVHKGEHRSDKRRLLYALVWQITTFLMPMALMLHAWGAFALIALPWAVSSLLLLRDWNRSA